MIGVESGILNGINERNLIEGWVWVEDGKGIIIVDGIKNNLVLSNDIINDLIIREFGI